LQAKNLYFRIQKYGSVLGPTEAGPDLDVIEEMNLLIESGEVYQCEPKTGFKEIGLQGVTLEELISQNSGKSNLPQLVRTAILEIRRRRT
jgi:hypothetical protein